MGAVWVFGREAIMRVTKNGLAFEVDVGGQVPELRAWWRDAYARWEPATFEVLRARLSPKVSYLDVGAWLGPTVLYAAGLAGRVYCLEPDPVAYAGLLRNLRVNPQYRNVYPMERCLSDREGVIRFGGNGALGNSESTMLAAEAGYAERRGEELRKRGVRKERAWRQTATVPVRTVTIESLEQEWGLAHCALVKVDVEGGEKVVVPALADFLRRRLPTLLLSLHWVYLTRAEIARVVGVVDGIYGAIHLPDCRTAVSTEEILDRRVRQIVCLGRQRKGSGGGR